jgi:deoxycytidylate deaminase
MIIQSGIRKIVYLKDVYHHTDGTCASRVMLRCAKVELQQYIPTMPTMIVKYYDQES